MTTQQFLDKGIWYCLLLYALSSCISIAGANIAISLAGLLMFIRYIQKPFEVSFDKKLAVLMTLFLATMLLSAIVAPDPINGMLRLWSYFYRMFPLFISVAFIKEEIQITKLLFIMGISLFVADSYAIWQGLHSDPRASAFSSHPMIFAGYLIQTIPLFLVYTIEKSKTDIAKLTMPLLLFSFAALIFNATRGAWLAVVGTLFLYIIVFFRKKYITMLISLGIFVFIGVALLQVPVIYERVATIADMSNQSNSERLLLWNSARQMFFDHPVTGVGLGNFDTVYLEHYISPLAKERLTHAHNNFVHMLAETGLLGFMSFVALFGYILYDSYRDYVRQQRVWKGILFVVTLALLLQGCSEFNFGDSAVIRMYWFIAGIAYCSVHSRT